MFLPFFRNPVHVRIFWDEAIGTVKRLRGSLAA